MTKKMIPTGVWTALVTPFFPDGSIDFHSLEKLVAEQVAAGVDGVIPCGTTGESPTLTLDEKKSVIQFVWERVKNTHTQLFAGTGSNQTAETIEFSKWASKLGVQGLLLVTPYYNKPQAGGIEAHFTAVADAVDCCIMLYNVPGRSAVAMTPASIARLSNHPRIVAIKEASGNLPMISAIRDRVELSPNFGILSGDDETFLPAVSLGGCGVVSVASNLFPVEMVALDRAARSSGGQTTALELHQKFYPLFRDLFVETNPVPIKTALSLMGKMSAHVRAPLAPLSAASLQTLKDSMIKTGILKNG